MEDEAHVASNRLAEQTKDLEQQQQGQATFEQSLQDVLGIQPNQQRTYTGSGLVTAQHTAADYESATEQGEIAVQAQLHFNYQQSQSVLARTRLFLTPPHKKPQQQGDVPPSPHSEDEQPSRRRTRGRSLFDRFSPSSSPKSSPAGAFSAGKGPQSADKAASSPASTRSPSKPSAVSIAFGRRWPERSPAKPASRSSPSSKRASATDSVDQPIGSVRSSQDGCTTGTMERIRQFISPSRRRSKSLDRAGSVGSPNQRSSYDSTAAAAMAAAVSPTASASGAAAAGAALDMRLRLPSGQESLSSSASPRPISPTKQPEECDSPLLSHKLFQQQVLRHSDDTLLVQALSSPSMLRASPMPAAAAAAAVTASAEQARFAQQRQVAASPVDGLQQQPGGHVLAYLVTPQHESSSSMQGAAAWAGQTPAQGAAAGAAGQQDVTPAQVTPVQGTPYFDCVGESPGEPSIGAAERPRSSDPARALLMASCPANFFATRNGIGRSPANSAVGMSGIYQSPPAAAVAGAAHAAVNISASRSVASVADCRSSDSCGLVDSPGAGDAFLTPAPVHTSSGAHAPCSPASRSPARQGRADSTALHDDLCSELSTCDPDAEQYSPSAHGSTAYEQQYGVPGAWGEGALVQDPHSSSTVVNWDSVAAERSRNCSATSSLAGSPRLPGMRRLGLQSSYTALPGGESAGEPSAGSLGSSSIVLPDCDSPPVDAARRVLAAKQAVIQAAAGALQAVRQTRAPGAHAHAPAAAVGSAASPGAQTAGSCQAMPSAGFSVATEVVAAAGEPLSPVSRTLDGSSTARQLQELPLPLQAGVFAHALQRAAGMEADTAAAAAAGAAAALIAAQGASAAGDAGADVSLTCSSNGLEGRAPPVEMSAGRFTLSLAGVSVATMRSSEDGFHSVGTSTGGASDGGIGLGCVFAAEDCLTAVTAAAAAAAAANVDLSMPQGAAAVQHGQESSTSDSEVASLTVAAEQGVRLQADRDTLDLEDGPLSLGSETISQVFGRSASQLQRQQQLQHLRSSMDEPRMPSPPAVAAAGGDAAAAGVSWEEATPMQHSRRPTVELLGTRHTTGNTSFASLSEEDAEAALADAAAADAAAGVYAGSAGTGAAGDDAPTGVKWPSLVSPAQSPTGKGPGVVDSAASGGISSLLSAGGCASREATAQPAEDNSSEFVVLDLDSDRSEGQQQQQQLSQQRLPSNREVTAAGIAATVASSTTTALILSALPALFRPQAVAPEHAANQAVEGEASGATAPDGEPSYASAEALSEDAVTAAAAAAATGEAFYASTEALGGDAAAAAAEVAAGGEAGSASAVAAIGECTAAVAAALAASEASFASATASAQDAATAGDEPSDLSVEASNEHISAAAAAAANAEEDEDMLQPLQQHEPDSLRQTDTQLCLSQELLQDVSEVSAAGDSEQCLTHVAPQQQQQQQSLHWQEADAVPQLGLWVQASSAAAESSFTDTEEVVAPQLQQQQQEQEGLQTQEVGALPESSVWAQASSASADADAEIAAATAAVDATAESSYADTDELVAPQLQQQEQQEGLHRQGTDQVPELGWWAQASPAAAESNFADAEEMVAHQLQQQQQQEQEGLQTQEVAALPACSLWAQASSSSATGVAEGSFADAEEAVRPQLQLQQQQDEGLQTQEVVALPESSSWAQASSIAAAAANTTAATAESSYADAEEAVAPQLQQQEQQECLHRLGTDQVPDADTWVQASSGAAIAPDSSCADPKEQVVAQLQQQEDVASLHRLSSTAAPEPSVWTQASAAAVATAAAAAADGSIDSADEPAAPWLQQQQLLLAAGLQDVQQPLLNETHMLQEQWQAQGLAEQQRQQQQQEGREEMQLERPAADASAAVGSAVAAPAAQGLAQQQQQQPEGVQLEEPEVVESGGGSAVAAVVAPELLESPRAFHHHHQQQRQQQEGEEDDKQAASASAVAAPAVAAAVPAELLEPAESPALAQATEVDPAIQQQQGQLDAVSARGSGGGSAVIAVVAPELLEAPQQQVTEVPSAADPASKQAKRKNKKQKRKAKAGALVPAHAADACAAAATTTTAAVAEVPVGTSTAEDAAAGVAAQLDNSEQTSVAAVGEAAEVPCADVVGAADAAEHASKLQGIKQAPPAAPAVAAEQLCADVREAGTATVEALVVADAAAAVAEDATSAAAAAAANTDVDTAVLMADAVEGAEAADAAAKAGAKDALAAIAAAAAGAAVDTALRETDAGAIEGPVVADEPAEAEAEDALTAVAAPAAETAVCEAGAGALSAPAAATAAARAAAEDAVTAAATAAAGAELDTAVYARGAGAIEGRAAADAAGVADAEEALTAAAESVFTVGPDDAATPTAIAAVAGGVSYASALRRPSSLAGSPAVPAAATEDGAAAAADSAEGAAGAALGVGVQVEQIAADSPQALDHGTPGAAENDTAAASAASDAGTLDRSSVQPAAQQDPAVAAADEAAAGSAPASVDAKQPRSYAAAAAAAASASAAGSSPGDAGRAVPSSQLSGRKDKTLVVQHSATGATEEGPGSPWAIKAASLESATSSTAGSSSRFSTPGGSSAGGGSSNGASTGLSSSGAGAYEDSTFGSGARPGGVLGRCAASGAAAAAAGTETGSGAGARSRYARDLVYGQFSSDGGNKQANTVTTAATAAAAAAVSDGVGGQLGGKHVLFEDSSDGQTPELLSLSGAPATAVARSRLQGTVSAASEPATSSMVTASETVGRSVDGGASSLLGASEETSSADTAAAAEAAKQQAKRRKKQKRKSTASSTAAVQQAAADIAEPALAAAAAAQSAGTAAASNAQGSARKAKQQSRGRRQAAAAAAASRDSMWGVGLVLAVLLLVLSGGALLCVSPTGFNCSPARFLQQPSSSSSSVFDTLAASAAAKQSWLWHKTQGVFESTTEAAAAAQQALFRAVVDSTAAADAKRAQIWQRTQDAFETTTEAAAAAQQSMFRAVVDSTAAAATRSEQLWLTAHRSVSATAAAASVTAGSALRKAHDTVSAAATSTGLLWGKGQDAVSASAMTAAAQTGSLWHKAQTSLSATAAAAAAKAGSMWRITWGSASESAAAVADTSQQLWQSAHDSATGTAAAAAAKSRQVWQQAQLTAAAAAAAAQQAPAQAWQLLQTASSVTYWQSALQPAVQKARGLGSWRKQWQQQKQAALQRQRQQSLVHELQKLLQQYERELAAFELEEAAAMRRTAQELSVRVQRMQEQKAFQAASKLQQVSQGEQHDSVQGADASGHPSGSSGGTSVVSVLRELLEVNRQALDAADQDLQEEMTLLLARFQAELQRWQDVRAAAVAPATAAAAAAEVAAEAAAATETAAASSAASVGVCDTAATVSAGVGTDSTPLQQQQLHQGKGQEEAVQEPLSASSEAEAALQELSDKLERQAVDTEPDTDLIMFQQQQQQQGMGDGDDDGDSAAYELLEHDYEAFLEQQQQQEQQQVPANAAADSSQASTADTVTAGASGVPAAADTEEQDVLLQLARTLPVDTEADTEYIAFLERQRQQQQQAAAAEGEKAGPDDAMEHGYYDYDNYTAQQQQQQVVQPQPQAVESVESIDSYYIDEDQHGLQQMQWHPDSAPDQQQQEQQEGQQQQGGLKPEAHSEVAGAEDAGGKGKAPAPDTATAAAANANATAHAEAPKAVPVRELQHGSDSHQGARAAVGAEGAASTAAGADTSASAQAELTAADLDSSSSSTTGKKPAAKRWRLGAAVAAIAAALITACASVGLAALLMSARQAAGIALAPPTPHTQLRQAQETDWSDEGDAGEWGEGADFVDQADVAGAGGEIQPFGAFGGAFGLTSSNAGLLNDDSADDESYVPTDVSSEYSDDGSQFSYDLSEGDLEAETGAAAGLGLPRQLADREGGSFGGFQPHPAASPAAAAAGGAFGAQSPAAAAAAAAAAAGTAVVAAAARSVRRYATRTAGATEFLWLRPNNMIPRNVPASPVIEGSPRRSAGGVSQRWLRNRVVTSIEGTAAHNAEVVDLVHSQAALAYSSPSAAADQHQWRLSGRSPFMGGSSPGQQQQQQSPQRQQQQKRPLSAPKSPAVQGAGTGSSPSRSPGRLAVPGTSGGAVRSVLQSSGRGYGQYSPARLGVLPKPEGGAGSTQQRSPRKLRDDRADVVLGE